jgi:hypothetical protein
MGMALGWMLLALVGATPGTQEPTHEAICGLKFLFELEHGHLGERERYEPSPRRVGFLPLPCPDGTRPAASGENAVGGCRFVFTVTQAGTTPESFRAEALGVAPEVQGLRLVLDAQGKLSQEGSRLPVADPDCEAWRRVADPLWRYHDIEGLHGCRAGPYEAKHPCAVALADLADLARAGVGVAVREYAAHPTARELAPLEPPTPPLTLCGLLASREERVRAAETLERGGALVAAVLESRCHPDGLRVALPRILRRLETVCPEGRCLDILALARGVRLPDLETLIQTHATTIAEALVRPQPQDNHGERLSVVMGIPGPQASAFTQALNGTWRGLEFMEGLKAQPLVLALLDRVRLAHPELAPRVELSRELMGVGRASPAAFRAWTTTAPCQELNDAHLLKLSPERLYAIAETQERCQGTTVSILDRYTDTLPPPDLMRVLRPLTDEQLGWFHEPELNLDDPQRANALVEWALERHPPLVNQLHATLPVVQKLLLAHNAERLGGREAVLDLLLRHPSSWRGTMDEDALLFLLQEALRGTPTPERVQSLATFTLPPEQLHRLLAGVLNSPDARLRAAAARGLVEEEGRVPPRQAARACLAEMRERFQCFDAVGQRMGPPPEYRRVLPTRGQPPTPQPLELYCDQLRRDTRACQPLCGAELPGREVLARLERAAGESLPAPAVLRACAGLP